MPIPITMPRLSDTMQQGTIVKWNVKEGQKVKSGDVIADIETDKATMELQSFDDGVVASIAVAEGQTVPVGTVMLVLAGAGEDAAAIKTTAGGAAAAPAPRAASAGQQQTGQPPARQAPGRGATAVAEPPRDGHGANGSGRVFASPLARKIAEESGVDLGAIQGSGPGGRIVRRDVEEVLASGAPQPGGRPQAQMSAPARAASPAPAPRTAPTAQTRTAPVEARGTRMIPVSNMRRVIAQRLSESKSTIPHYQVTVDVEMSALMALRAQLNDQLAPQGVKLSVNDFLVRACALAMHEHPFVNARWVTQQGKHGAVENFIEQIGDVNIGVAIALPVNEDGTGGGLVVATLRNADQMGLRQISAQSKALAEKARTKGLAPNEMDGATFTISNLGMLGVAHFNAIINPPNVAILAVGAAIEKPVVRDGRVEPGLVMSMTMSSDHRVVDGAMAAQYLATVRNSLEKPATLLV
ncbi:MAG TPA: dihydrolipoamide acetyltransferase family protein [Phycisphaerales bacterium]|nr:dihydrolipoamide acetyltransferase family protein [Phycisphaerales bacterium]